jgi:hypothetical protein
MNTKRLVVASVCGLLFGFVCFGLASSSPGGVPGAVAWQLIFSRFLIGFAIGISCLNMGHWAIHGLFMGFLFSLPLAFSGLMAPDNPQFSKASMFVWTVALGMIYGFLTELITSVLFRARFSGGASITA